VSAPLLPQVRHDAAALAPPRWGWFCAWAAVGALLPVSILGALTIGIFVLPLFVVGVLLLARSTQGRRSAVGVVAGFGMPFLLLAYFNRSGPGNVCTTTATSQECTQEWTPWPFLAIGLLIVAGSIALFQWQRSRHARRLATPPPVQV
jgi:hypothetical protein